MNKLAKLAAALLALASVNVAQAVSFDYSNIEGSFINFTGDGNFNFNGGPNLEITSGPLSGLLGAVEGTFTIGAGVNSAAVSGTGMFSIDDGMGSTFSADLVWVDIFRAGAAGGLNFNSSVNLTNFSYAGANATLLELLNDGSAINTLTFQFAATGDLNNLRNVAQETSFSGTVSSVTRQVPDGGTTAALLGLGLVGMSFIARRRLA